MLRNSFRKSIWSQIILPISQTTNLYRMNRYHFSTPQGAGTPTTGLRDGSFVTEKMDLNQKIEALEKSQPFFDRIMFFDPDIMANLPGPLERFDPIVETGKDMLVYFHDLGLPWYKISFQRIQNMITYARILKYFQNKTGGVLFQLHAFYQDLLLCLQFMSNSRELVNLLQQNTSNKSNQPMKIIQIAPVLIQVKKLADQCQVSRSKRIQLIASAWFTIIREQKLKMWRLFAFNLVNIPLIITMVWSIRRTMVEESVKNTSFLWVPSFTQIDPYFILPALAVAGYYWNLQRFITPENKHTLISKIRGIGQILLILWLPLLSNWPSLIQWYILNNAIYSLIQTTLITHPNFIRFVEPKMLLYQFILKTVEYDKISSETLVESIKSGEDSFKDKSIQEEVLVQQMEDMLRKLNEETIEETMDDVRKYTESDLKF